MIHNMKIINRLSYNDISAFIKKSDTLRQVLGVPKRIIIQAVTPYLLTQKVNLQWLIKGNRKNHDLPGRLVVSLTSYPARFRTLSLTLKCLLRQSVTPDRIILWIAHQDKCVLPFEILDLRTAGLEILFYDDIKSYKKIIPTLHLEPNAFIVTADDDVYYWPTWLEELIKPYNNDNNIAICHRAHEISLNKIGLPNPYTEWTAKTCNTIASPLHFPTGVGGVMYPPGIFHPDVLKLDLINTLCPLADDVWLYWMVRRNGGKFQKTPSRHFMYTWPNSQITSLYNENVLSGGNDAQICSMIKEYGFPVT